MKRVRWEYLVKYENAVDLETLGNDGWELVSVVSDGDFTKMYFKRPAPTLSEEITLSQRDAVLKERGQK